MGHESDERMRTAHCACGAMTVSTRGEPADVYLCSCLDCQRGTGSAFSYGALFPEPAVRMAGETRTYTHRAESGRSVVSWFCPTCGTTVAFRAEGLPGMVGVPAGCFADPGFAKPTKLFWASRRHHWLDLPDDIAPIETQ
ncbi:hypothetical protein AUC68_08665 [Methyloceanibacter methanicus]|uniref:CENP-V/GFA domain-containing protein n=1 Tax=Methyloceanibacter methanicus TaxID=1774968 RepID=A0A1E3VY98_9HYPH|nr:GFA family protein [Methyloceanibacter methanicus]ODR98489.1 hypothetical protein AUC68_08665 [Methyloceanibacter methanicus]